jgi:O-antigen ligase
VAVAAAWWLVGAARLWGGRGSGAVTIGAILTAVAVVTTQPHRWLPARAIWGALAVSAGALGVAATSPTGWDGVATAASYVCASWTVVAVAAAVVRDARVIDLVLVIVVAGTLVEFGEAWLAWWGGADASNPMSGTFYWYDPYAAFLIAGTVIGLSLWLRLTGPLAALGLGGCMLGMIGIIYSTSRAAAACVVVGVLLVCAVHVAQRRMHALVRAGIALAATTAGVWLIAGPPFFPHRATPLAGTVARAAGQSLGQNGGYRLDFWREALGVFDRHPITGGGYHSLATGSFGHVPRSWPLSPLAHNGFLQALSDGGFMLGVPFLFACAAAAWWVVSSLATAVRARDITVRTVAVPLTLGALLAHSAIDFDWSYAADFLSTAVLAGVLAGTRWSRPGSAPAPGRRMATAVAVAVGVALIGVSAGSAWSGDLRQSLPLSPAAAQGGTA